MEDVIKDYILVQPKEIQAKLFELKAIIEEAIPDATKRLAWGMP